MKKKLLAGGAVALVTAGLGFVPVGGGLAVSTPRGSNEEGPMALDEYSADAPGEELRLLFVHHSVGGQLLADEGDDVGENSIYTSYPRGGGLRALLQSNGYQVGEASYGSRLGAHTDIFDWLPKFRDHMDDVLRVARQDDTLPGEERNDIVVFKSCFPNSKFVARGEGRGDPTGPELSLVNAQATMNALLPYFAAHPDALFVYVTAPPLAPRVGSDPAWKWLAKKVLGRSWGPAELARSGEIARDFNAWLEADDGWLADHTADNVAVFNYWHALTGDGESNLLHYYVGRGYDSHPAGEGQRRAAPRLVETLNRAVRRARLITPDVPPVTDADPEVSDEVD
ncbi:MAG: hypothetical protein DRJ42_30760 [Deltaproteobacteria bacterium]|nr:MAG: hypothetical protein DRJ42_30760 [Deltaproteobacteria bacterium]